MSEFSVNWNGEAGLELVRRAAAAALYEEGERIMADSQENYCPVAPDGGALRSTGHVSPPERTEDGITVTLSYGGPAVRYAVPTHEHLSEHSPYSWRVAEARGTGVHWNVGGPKYLELPVLAAASGFTERVGADARERL